jgi:hypothetical protein
METRYRDAGRRGIGLAQLIDDVLVGKRDCPTYVRDIDLT